MRHRTQKNPQRKSMREFSYSKYDPHLPAKRQSTAEMGNIRSRGSEELQLCGARHILPLCELSWY